MFSRIHFTLTSDFPTVKLLWNLLQRLSCDWLFVGFGTTGFSPLAGLLPCAACRQLAYDLFEVLQATGNDGARDGEPLIIVMGESRT